ncbi:MAG: hypothetical protein Crog4KO_27240 [Crocinitomicaceae bacterium]
MKSLKFYKILSITLVILNLITIGFIYFNRPPGPPPRGEARLANDIGLTGESKKKVDALEIQHHKDKRKLVKENFQLQRKLYGQLSDSEKSQAILTEIHANRTEMDRMTFEFFSDVAELCNEEQRKNLDNIIDKGLRRITNLPHKR